MSTDSRSTARAVTGSTGHLVADWVHARPRTMLTVRATFAAGVAWLLLIPFGGVADDYAYYAPLGAVVVMSTTAMSSVRTGLQSVAAIAIGACLAVLAHQLPTPRVVGVMLVIGVGMALASWPRLGEMGVWVPFASLFVFILGGHDTEYYVLGYLGLTAVGAAVGILVNLATPQLPLGRTLQALTALKEELARQLRSLTEDLRSADDLGTDGGWISSSVQLPARRLERLILEVRDGRQLNWRAGRWQELADRREQQAQALETIAYVVEEVGALLTRSSTHLLRGRTGIGDAVANALEATAEMLEGTDLASAPDDAVPSTRARACVEELRRVSLERDATEAPDAILAGSSATVTLLRAIEAWE